MPDVKTTVTVVRERVVPFGSLSQALGPESAIYHLPAPGVVEACTGECDWHAVICGGGIAFPGHFDEVPAGDVCSDCQVGRVTMTAPPTRRRKTKA